MKILVIGNQRDCYKSDGSGVVLWDFLEWFVNAGCRMSFLSASKVAGRADATRMQASVLPAGVTERLPGYARASGGWVSLSPAVWLGKIAMRLGLCPRPVAKVYTYDQILSMDDALTIADMVQKERFDVVIADYVWCAPVFKLLGANVNKGVIAHDIIQSRIDSMRASGVVPDISDKVAQIEMELMSLADFALIETGDDKKCLDRNTPRVKTFLMPRTIHVRTSPKDPVPGRVLFVGGTATHNVQGISWFLEKVWLRVLAGYPAANLQVLGAIASKLEAGFPNIDLVGPVPELDSHYHEASVCIVPLLSGSGFKTKLIEAMGFGKACVSTTAGAAGLEKNSETPVLIEDDEAAFATAIVRFLENESYRRDYEKRSAAHARGHFGPDAVYGPILEYFKSASTPPGNSST